MNVVYDAGFLIGSRRNAAGHKALLVAGVVPLLPATVLAQVLRGNDPILSRILTGCAVVPLDRAAARAVGLLLRDSATTDVVDAHVVHLALTLDAAVWTSDPDDLHHIAETAAVRIRLIPV